MMRVTVSAPPRPYEVLIERGLLKDAGEALRAVADGRKNVFVVTVPPVPHNWRRQLLSSLAAAGFHARLILMADGESHKKLATVEKLAERLSRLGADRDALVVAFGGGVVGDVAALLASLYMRGVDVAQVPTTVLAQVDAAIGGKTGVNLRAGKNLLGTFHQPLLVLNDPAVLASLPEREFRAGLYEALKCGVIGRPALFEKLEKVRVKSLRRNAVELNWVIAEAVKLKAEVVSSDERESGLRRVLNFGHTIGHAIEAESGYRRFKHGEAVAWGMIAAARIAAMMMTCSMETAGRITDAVLRLGPLPTVVARPHDIARLLSSDKKTREGIVHFILPRKIGEVEVARDVPETLVVEAVKELRRISR
jgi:3-dehydroquinate synthase